MLRADMTPKPVYSQLEDLIHTRWKTQAAGKTDAAGRFTFRGFHGTYQIVAETNGKRAEQEFQLKKDGSKELTVTLPTTSGR